MQVTKGASGATFKLTAETEADRALLDAIDLIGAHAITSLAKQRTPAEGGFINSGVTLLVDRNHPHVLERQAGRQLLGAVREFFRLGLGQDALHGHVSTYAADPDAQHQLATQLDKLQLMLQALRVAVCHPESIRQEAHSTHAHPSNGCDQAILKDQLTGASAAAHVTHNAWLPAALRPYAAAMFGQPRTHQSVELHGITLRDHTAYLSGSEHIAGMNPEQLWLGIDFEGRSLRPEQALELAEALRLMALAHMQRVSAGGAA